MKKMITIVTALALTLALLVSAVPVAANGTTETVDMTADVGGTGSAPGICAAFITPDHSLDPGTQILPLPAGNRTVKFYVVAEDAQGLDSIVRIDVAVFYDESETNKKFQKTTIKGEANWKPILWTGLVDMNGDCTGDTSITDAMTALDAQGRIVYGGPYNLAAVLYDLEHDKQRMFEVMGEMDYHQPAQTYFVRFAVTDADGNTSFIRTTFEYLGIVALAKDFTTVSFGTVKIGDWNVRLGDSNMGTPDRPTVRNIGNIPGKLEVEASVMTNPDGKTITEEFDVRIHGLTVKFPANTPTIVEDATGVAVLEVCTPTQIDFSLKPPVGTYGGSYSGSMTLTIMPLGNA